MKKILLIFLFVGCVTVSFSQERVYSPTQADITLLQLSKDQKKLALLLIGVGTLAIVGETLSKESFEPFGYQFVGGSLSFIGGIRIYISSVKNKRKALNLSLRTQ